MTTPEFEEWLMRQDIPVEETLDIEAYQTYLADEFEISGGSLDVAKNVYAEKYDILGQLDIRPFDMTRTIQGVEYSETRYAIKGLRGAFGYQRALDIALERAEEQAWAEAVDWLTAKIATL